jgi:hypothetical protein
VGLFGPSFAFSVASTNAAMYVSAANWAIFVSAVVGCVWLATLAWGMSDDGLRALLLLLPSFLMILIGAYAGLAVICAYINPCF